jgi:hypothetical protein
MANIDIDSVYKSVSEYLIVLTDTVNTQPDFLKIELFQKEDKSDIFFFKIFSYDSFYFKKGRFSERYEKRNLFYKDNGYFTPRCKGIRANSEEEAISYLVEFINYRLHDDWPLSKNAIASFVDLKEML